MADKATTGAENPSEEITEEITEEMIEAGASVLMRFETYTTDEAYWAEKVYLAMRKARSRKS